MKLIRLRVLHDLSSIDRKTAQKKTHTQQSSQKKQSNRGSGFEWDAKK